MQLLTYMKYLYFLLLFVSAGISEFLNTERKIIPSFLSGVTVAEEIRRYV